MRYMRTADSHSHDLVVSEDRDPQPLIAPANPAAAGPLTVAANDVLVLLTVLVDNLGRLIAGVQAHQQAAVLGEVAPGGWARLSDALGQTALHVNQVAIICRTTEEVPGNGCARVSDTR